VTGPGTISFWWRISSESSYDRLEFSINEGVIAHDRIDGTVEWQQRTHYVPGTGSYSVVWTYRKDGGGSAGSDCAWLDRVAWTPGTPGVSVSGTVSGATQGGVTITFTRTSGSGAIPAPVTTLSNGAWSQTGFANDTHYRATPSMAGYTFTPPYIDWIGSNDSLDFTAAAPFGVSGAISGATQSGVTITFSRVSGAGAIPPAVTTRTDGRWSQTGFSTGTTYRARPSKDGFTFDPLYRDFSGTSSSLNFTAAPAVVSLQEALDHTSHTFTTGGDADWFGQTSIHYNDGDAAQSGAIGNGRQSVMYMTVSGPATVSFYWRVSSEPSYDWLELYLDTTRVTRWSGYTSWRLQTVSVPSGTHTVGWRYVKDRSVSHGADRGWVDRVTVTP